MCLEQVDAKCLKTHEKALDKAKRECETADSSRQKTCVTDKVAEKETEEVAICVTDKMPTCQDDCKKSWCNINKMNKCLDNLGSTSEVTGEFCKDFWQLLHESSEVDPETGKPIVFLARNMTFP